MLQKNSITSQAPVDFSNMAYKEVRRKQLGFSSKSTFSPAFIYWLIERMMNVLYAHLKAQQDLQGTKILDSLIVLLMTMSRMKAGKLKGIDDENVVAIVGQMSYLLDFSE